MRAHLQYSTICVNPTHFSTIYHCCVQENLKTGTHVEIGTHIIFSTRLSWMISPFLLGLAQQKHLLGPRKTSWAVDCRQKKWAISPRDGKVHPKMKPEKIVYQDDLWTVRKSINRFILPIYKCWARENTICWAVLDGSRVNTLRCQTWLAGITPLEMEVEWENHL